MIMIYYFQLKKKVLIGPWFAKKVILASHTVDSICFTASNLIDLLYDTIHAALAKAVAAFRYNNIKFDIKKYGM